MVLAVVVVVVLVVFVVEWSGNSKSRIRIFVGFIRNMSIDLLDYVTPVIREITGMQ